MFGDIRRRRVRAALGGDLRRIRGQKTRRTRTCGMSPAKASDGGGPHHRCGAASYVPGRRGRRGHSAWTGSRRTVADGRDPLIEGVHLGPVAYVRVGPVPHQSPTSRSHLMPRVRGVKDTTARPTLRPRRCSTLLSQQTLGEQDDGGPGPTTPDPLRSRKGSSERRVGASSLMRGRWRTEPVRHCGSRQSHWVSFPVVLLAPVSWMSGSSPSQWTVALEPLMRRCLMSRA